MKILSSSCFPSKRRGGFVYTPSYRVGTESFTSLEKSWNWTTVSSGRVLGCRCDRSRVWHYDYYYIITIYIYIITILYYHYIICIAFVGACCWDTDNELSAFVVDVVVGDGRDVRSAQPSWLLDAFVRRLGWHKWRRHALFVSSALRKATLAGWWEINFMLIQVDKDTDAVVTCVTWLPKHARNRLTLRHVEVKLLFCDTVHAEICSV